MMHMPILVETAPAEYTDAQRAEWDRLIRMTVNDLRREAGRTHVYTRGTKHELVSRIVQGDPLVLDEAEAAPVPVFEVPGEEATREELEAALRTQAENFRDRKQAARSFAISVHRSPRGPRICRDGLNQFLREFDLPRYHSSGDAAKPVLIPADDLRAEWYTNEGLRNVLAQRVTANNIVMEQMREYALARSGYFELPKLNRVFVILGLDEWRPPVSAEIRLQWSWSVTADFPQEQQDEWRRAAEARIRNVLDELKGPAQWADAHQIMVVHTQQQGGRY
jgi:hypothetical protein